MPSIFAAASFDALWQARVAASAERIALLVRRGREYVPRTWSDVDQAVRITRDRLRRAGLERGQHVAQISANRPEWVASDQAVLTFGAVHVPLHVGLSGVVLARQIEHSDATILIIEDESVAAKLRPHVERLQNLVAIFSHEPVKRPVAGHDVIVLMMDSLRPSETEAAWCPHSNPTRSSTSENAERISVDADASEGRKSLAIVSGGLRVPLASDADERLISNDSESPAAMILYTSGTAGMSRAVVLTADNLLCNAATLMGIYQYRTDDVRLVMLPLSHIYARTCELTTWILGGSILAIAGSRETVLSDCAAVGPTMLNGVPYFYDKIRRIVTAANLPDEVAAIKQIFGGRMRSPRCGGATLSAETFTWYRDRGTTILQGYGQTEASPVIATSTPERLAPGSVGPALPGTELCVSEAGELLVRGPQVMREYYKDPDATARVLRNGWLHTGDLATIDDTGLVRIVGRISERIVLSTGKKVMPIDVENALTAAPWIEQAVAIGQNRSCLAALIVLSETGRANLAVEPDEQRRLDFLTMRIADRQRDFASHERIAFFAVLAEPLTSERGELTAKLSLCRPVIESRYQDVIDSLYEKRGSVMMTPLDNVTV